MKTKEILLEQFTACYNENGWFVALKNAVKNLTAKQAIWKTENLDNSIWEILSHLNFYNEAYLKRFKGMTVDYSGIENSETFSGAETVSEEAWQAEIEKFDSIMTEWRSLLEAAESSKFDEAVSATNNSAWSSLIAHINAHNAHHGGQIVVLRKLQGSWDAKQGVS
ncbi:MAG: DinB family protein [Acidobacteriota bacterium]|nr:DinB family protein [Acidobacteriota bacterium]